MEWMAYFPVFLLIFVRWSAFFVAAPIFMTRGIPAQFNIGLAFLLALMTFGVIGPPPSAVIDASFPFLVLKEVAVGLMLGFIAAMFLYAVQIAGSFMDLQIGFAIANIFDPQTGIQTPVTGRFKYWFALVFFLTLNGHHVLLQGVMTSYDLIGPMEWIPVLFEGPVAEFVVEAFAQMFLIAFMIASPIVGTVFLVDVAIGIIARTVPQMNVFVVGIPAKIFTSLLVLLVVLPGFFYMLRRLFAEMFTSLRTLIQILGA